MESPHGTESDPPLLLPSLRLFIPPLRLVSAAMWQVIQKGDVQDYGLVEEFISTVTDIVPELLNADQKAKLLLGLRARVVLELCRTEEITDTETIEMHLERIKALVSTWAAQPCFAELEFPESNFVDQVELLLKDPEEKEKFFQDVFPMDFGPEYDSALQVLMLDFLSRLEKLLPVPDIQQTASMLSAVPSALEECVHSVPDPQHLKTVLLHHTTLGHFDLSDETQTIPSSFGNCILSSLSLPQLEKVVIDADQMQLQPTSEQMQGCMTVQVEGETVTLMDYIQIEQPSGLVEPVEPEDHDENEVNVEETTVDATNEDMSDTLKPAAFQPSFCEKKFKNPYVSKRHQKKTCKRATKTMGSGKQLSEDLKMKLVNLHKAGEGYKNISKCLGIPLPTVKTIIQKWKKRGHTKTLPRSGRPRKITESGARKPDQELHNNPEQTEGT